MALKLLKLPDKTAILQHLGGDSSPTPPGFTPLPTKNLGCIILTQLQCGRQQFLQSVHHLHILVKNKLYYITVYLSNVALAYCYCYDKLKSESPCTAIIAAGDFNPDSNGLNIRTITRQCHIKQIVKAPTSDNAVLDLIITDIHKFYEDPEILPKKRPKNIWRPKNRNQLGNKKGKRTVTPLRDSSILQFEQFIREYNCMVICI